MYIKIIKPVEKDNFIIEPGIVLEVMSSNENTYQAEFNSELCDIPKDSVEEVFPFYITFMQRQEALKKAYCVIYAKDKEEATEMMYNTIGDNWAMIYDTDGWVYKKGSPMWNSLFFYRQELYDKDQCTQAEAWNLTPVSLDYVIDYANK